MANKSKLSSSGWRSTIKEILLCTIFAGVVVFTIAEFITGVMNLIGGIGGNGYQVGRGLGQLIIGGLLVFLSKSLRNCLEKKEPVSSSEIKDKSGNKEILGNQSDGRILKNILLCKGRLGRIELFFYRGIGLILFFILSMVLFFLLGGENVNQNLREIVVVVLGILTVIRDLIVCSGRFHDLGKSGCFSLLLLIPILNLFLSARLLFGKGTNGDNKYGNEPNVASKKVKILTIIIWIILVIIFILGEILIKIADQL